MKSNIYKSILFFFLAFTCLSIQNVYSQRGEKIEALRIAFITNRLSLTSVESEKFWPIYNDYRNQLVEVRRQTNQEMNLEVMSDAEAERAIQAGIDRMEKELMLFKKLAADLRPVIPARKIALLSKVERNFNEELLKRSQILEGAGGRLRRN